MISTVISLPNLALDTLPSGSLISSNLTILDMDIYARGYVSANERLNIYFPTFYDQISRNFIENHIAYHPETVDIIVSNTDPVKILYERFKEGDREFFRCPEGTNRELSREIAVDRRLSNKCNILIYNGRPYKLEVYDRMWFSLAYLCKSFLRQDSENGILLTGLSACLLDGIFLARCNIEYNQLLVPSVFNADKISELLGPVSLKNHKLEDTIKSIKIKYTIDDDLLRKVVEEKEEVEIPDIPEKDHDKIEVDTITVEDLISGEFVSHGYVEVSDVECLTGERDEILPIKTMYVIGNNDDVYIDLTEGFKSPDVLEYVTEQLQKKYGIFAVEIF